MSQELSAEDLAILHDATRVISARLGGRPSEWLGAAWEGYSRAIKHYEPIKGSRKKFIISCAYRAGVDQFRRSHEFRTLKRPDGTRQRLFRKSELLTPLIIETAPSPAKLDLLDLDGVEELLAKLHPLDRFQLEQRLAGRAPGPRSNRLSTPRTRMRRVLHTLRGGL